MSPDKSFDLKLNSPQANEHGSSFNPYLPLPPSSLLFEPSSPNRTRSNSLSQSQTQSYHPRSSYPQPFSSYHAPAPPSFPTFEPFSEQLETPAQHPPAHALYSSSGSPRRPSGPSLSWRHEQQLPAPSEWLRSDEKRFEQPTGMVVAEDRSRSNSFSYAQQVPAHEVRSLCLSGLLSTIDSVLYSQSISSHSFIRPRRRLTMFLCLVSSSPPTNRRRYSCNRSSKWRT
jgi:hypothetical protein